MAYRMLERDSRLKSTQKRLVQDKPSAEVSLLLRELLVGVESLFIVKGGLLFSTTGYVGLSVEREHDFTDEFGVSYN